MAAAVCRTEQTWAPGTWVPPSQQPSYPLFPGSASLVPHNLPHALCPLLKGLLTSTPISLSLWSVSALLPAPSAVGLQASSFMPPGLLHAHKATHTDSCPLPTEHLAAELGQATYRPAWESKGAPGLPDAFQGQIPCPSQPHIWNCAGNSIGSLLRGNVSDLPRDVVEMESSGEGAQNPGSFGEIQMSPRTLSPEPRWAPPTPFYFLPCEN